MDSGWEQQTLPGLVDRALETQPYGQTAYLLGKAYMAFIKPFRYWIVYPTLMRRIERDWNARVPTGS